jgi:hypothetical protein
VQRSVRSAKRDSSRISSRQLCLSHMQHGTCLHHRVARLHQLDAHTRARAQSWSSDWTLCRR